MFVVCWAGAGKDRLFSWGHSEPCQVTVTALNSISAQIFLLYSSLNISGVQVDVRSWKCGYFCSQKARRPLITSISIIQPNGFHFLVSSHLVKVVMMLSACLLLSFSTKLPLCLVHRTCSSGHVGVVFILIFYFNSSSANLAAGKQDSSTRIRRTLNLRTKSLFCFYE